MKQQTHGAYLAPQIEVETINVECGIAASNPVNSNDRFLDILYDEEDL